MGCVREAVKSDRCTEILESLDTHSFDDVEIMMEPALVVTHDAPVSALAVVYLAPTTCASPAEEASVVTEEEESTDSAQMHGLDSEDEVEESTEPDLAAPEPVARTVLVSGTIDGQVMLFHVSETLDGERTSALELDYKVVLHREEIHPSDKFACTHRVLSVVVRHTDVYVS